MSVEYELIIYWGDENQSFVVEVPESPGCMLMARPRLLAGGRVAAYGLAGFLSTLDPLRVVILVFSVLPALPAFVMGGFMLRGRAWALRGLQAYVLVLVGAASGPP